MAKLEKAIRVAVTSIAVLASLLSFTGIVGVWWAERLASNVTLKGFGLVETAVGTIDTGAARLNELIAMSRTEVRHAAETIGTVDERVEAKRVVLTALNERLEARLAPRIEKMQQALTPVRDAVTTISNVLNLMNSMPMMEERAPRLAAMDETFDRVAELSVDTGQLRVRLQSLALPRSTPPLFETIISEIDELTRRIDTRLVEVQNKVREVEAEVAGLKSRMEARKSRVLILFKLMAVLPTLMLAWILYSQIVVIRHQQSRD